MKKIETRSEHAIGFAEYIRKYAYYNQNYGWFYIDSKTGIVHKTSEEIYDDYILFLNNAIETLAYNQEKHVVKEHIEL